MGQPSAWLIPLPVTHLYKDSSRLADKALLGGPASVGSQKPSYCGLQRISRSFEKQTSLHPDCGSRVLSLSFGEGLFRRLEKPELIFNFWLPKPPHVWSVDDLRLQNDRGGRECGLGLGGLSTRSEGGSPRWAVWPSLCSQQSHLGFSEMPSPAPQQWPSLLTSLEFFQESDLLELGKVPWSP